MKEPIVNCPHCGNSVTWKKASQFRPFCSERCKLIDAGNWAMGSYSVSDEDDFSDEDLT
ncbi:DNA gyrase inhibitor YacG [Burkholderiales bacterium]|nr:DNA gyrase inhibitor YacG [Burkholderiales bacterium]